MSCQFEDLKDHPSSLQKGQSVADCSCELCGYARESDQGNHRPMGRQVLARFLALRAAAQVGQRRLRTRPTEP